MTATQDLIDELNDSIAIIDVHHRVEALHGVTDLFASGGASFSKDQIDLFDEVMGRLMEEVDRLARIAFSQKLSKLPNAPQRISRTLAFDDDIDIAGPILSKSDRLDDATLIEVAQAKSQHHLLAIAHRPWLGEAVTDVLIERGNQEVLRSTSDNRNARLSEAGLSTLVQRSRADDRLALSIWMRPDVPRLFLARLVADASEALRLKFEAVDRRKADLLRPLVEEAAEVLQAEVRERSPVFIAARARVEALHTAGELGEHQLREFAAGSEYHETAVALSLMCDLPIAIIDRAIACEKPDQLVVLAKGIGLSWETAKALVALRAQVRNSPTADLSQLSARYSKLLQDTARKAIQFLRLRERAREAKHDRRPSPFE
ncbi:MAG: DUF2336 domain-containing protein [Blastochloris sp.]|nr:DUF2336 domain-containing protein [Blastochloris sp.]